MLRPRFSQGKRLPSARSPVTSYGVSSPVRTASRATGARLRRAELVAAATHQALRGSAQDASERLVGHHDRAVHRDRQPLEGTLHQRVEALLALAQRLLFALALGDVHGGQHGVHDPPARTTPA